MTNHSWRWPLDLTRYDRNPELSAGEAAALEWFIQRKETESRRTIWFSQMERAIPRLIRPLCHAADVLALDRQYRHPIIAVLLKKMHHDQMSYWAPSEDEWLAFFHSDWQRFSPNTRNVCASYLMLVLYLLGGFNGWARVATCRFTGLAQRVYGTDLYQSQLSRVSQALREAGYSEFCATRPHLSQVLGKALLINRNPYLEMLRIELLEELYSTTTNQNQRVTTRQLAYALFSLQLIPRPLVNSQVQAVRIENDDLTNGIHPEWVAWCQRWRDTSTYQPKTRQKRYQVLLRVGRWLATEHPEVVSPAHWTRELAAEYLAMVDKLYVGDWSSRHQSTAARKPLHANTKAEFINAARTFFRDCQEWGWVKLSLDPGRSFSVPRTILAQIQPAPRVIQDDVWAKILWAGLNLRAEDLLLEQPQLVKHSAYPIEMVRAVAIIWLFAGLRVNEICRLPLGCIRWQRQPDAEQAVCLLTVPVNKTSPSFTKPVDPVVGRAIETWEKVRPAAAPRLDSKTGKMVHLLFAYRGRSLGRGYINRTLIPTLCHKAGVPLADARGRITSHRARATIASQLYNAREGMSLEELQAWLGHRFPESTQHYVSVGSSRQAQAYAAAGYLDQNKRLVAVLIDQEAVRQGGAQAGEPWRYYDVGHGHCAYDFFDECPHRLACARCTFYIPKQSSRAQLLEAKTNLQQMMQEIRLSDQERAAVVADVLVTEKLLAQLADVPTPSGPTPRQMAQCSSDALAGDDEARL